MFYEMWHQPLMTVGRCHFIHEAIAFCGGQNIFADLDKNVVPVNLETVVARDPELIVTRDRFGKRADASDDWASLAALAAVKNQNVVTIPDSVLSMPTLSVLAGIRALCAHIESVRVAENHGAAPDLSSTSETL